MLFTVGRSSARPRRGTKQPPVGPDFGKDRLGGGQDLKDRLGGGGGVDSVDGAGKLLAYVSCQCNLYVSNVVVWATWITLKRHLFTSCIPLLVNFVNFC